MPSEATNEATRRVWRELGFFCDRNDAEFFVLHAPIFSRMGGFVKYIIPSGAYLRNRTAEENRRLHRPNRRCGTSR